MQVTISRTKLEAGERAARDGARLVRAALKERGEASIILATGASQFEMLSKLTREPVDWSRVRAFHLDEYIGLPETHPASFRRYLKERFVDCLPAPLKAFEPIRADDNPEAECRRLGEMLAAVTIDVAFVGIGENGHLAFNDPPADFQTNAAYLVVTLDEACRRQQLGEGWFPTFDDVPTHAISMSIRQIVKSRTVICTVPEERKAAAVKKTLEGAVTPLVPASILKDHTDCHLYLDRDSSRQLERKARHG